MDERQIFVCKLIGKAELFYKRDMMKIIGIPVGLQCFKFATLAFWPFGKEIVYGNGMFSFLVNLIWIIFFGWEMALGNLIVGCIWCITIVGIPFGKQFFKMARLSFMPFGASVIG